MSKTFSCLLLLVLSTLTTTAEDPTWSYRLVNATGLPGLLHFYINGEDILPTGYSSGEYTGTMLPISPMRVGARHPACGESLHEISLTLQPIQQISIIAYLQPDPPELATGRSKPARVPTKGKEEPKTRTILFHIMEAKPKPSARTGSIVSLCAAPGSVQVVKNAPPVLPVVLGSQPVSLSYGKEEVVTLNLGGADSRTRGTSQPVLFRGNSLAGLDLERNNDTAVVFFDDLVSGAPKCLTWFNNRHE
jgi:hypothetical protein